MEQQFGASNDQFIYKNVSQIRSSRIDAQSGLLHSDWRGLRITIPFVVVHSGYVVLNVRYIK